MATTPAPASLPPPRSEVGVFGWAQRNLFSSRFNSTLTIITGVLLALALFFGLKWVFLGANWTVNVELGGRFVIGQYNTEAACPGRNCFWRPQVALLMITALLGMGMGHGEWRRDAANRARRGDCRCRFRAAAVLDGNDGHGCARVACRQHSRAADWLGGGALHAFGQRQVGQHPCSGFVLADNSLAARSAGRARSSTRAGHLLGRLDDKPCCSRSAASPSACQSESRSRSGGAVNFPWSRRSAWHS